MSAAPTRAIEQLARHNPGPYLLHKQQQLDEVNVNLHSVEGTQLIGQAQGRAAALKEMVDEFERAGFEPAP